MKMFRLGLVGVVPALVLLLCIQLNVRAARTLPPPPDMPSWLTGADTVDHHIWLSVGTLNNAAIYATPKVAAPSQSRQLVFDDRVAYQRAIEEVYWRHRIWPKERPDPKPSLDAVMSQAMIEQKVQDYLRNSEAQEDYWQKAATGEQLQAEMERMAQQTRQPEVLRELFAALGNDPFVIAECLARPVLLERLQFVTVESRKGPLEPWSAKEAHDQTPDITVAANTTYTVPAISSQPSGCIDDAWTATSTTNAPGARWMHTAVWTGTEMIVWGGADIRTSLKSGGGYNPSTDSWTATTKTTAPTARFGHTAVWTGSEMIVWGGTSGVENTGGRYNPVTDSWTATSTTDAPTARFQHTAVWTGSEMIVWGGTADGGSNGLNTGGRYNPVTDSWTATSTTDAPAARFEHTAVWTGNEMIVWGGKPNGGRYNPSSDTWTATSTTNEPEGRTSHAAVWSGTEMIVWGGTNNNTWLNTGGRYNPGVDSWTATSTTNAPTARDNHTAVWTGSEMIVWGGTDNSFNKLNTGGRYNPAIDSWTATSTTNAPTGQFNHTGVFAGSEMIIWGGYGNGFGTNTGGRYCAQAGGPLTLSAAKRKVGGINTVRLTWSGATSTDIDVYRDGVLILTTLNDGSYTDSTGDTGRARYTYQVCEAGSSTCSNTAIVTFRQ